ncbi:MAG: ribosome recycling factor [Planctomycetes bacterium]|nr:ribosome recycling factor [Planctomycetota bacterium]MCK5473316.1 ribosome recycling factor [Planctomycetota bacterium]
MPTSKTISESKTRIQKAVEILKKDLKSVRTGRASTGLVENIQVDYYGTPTPIKQIASIVTPQSDLIVIKPFDVGALREIEKAIKNSDLSIAPVVDGKLVRLSIPALSEERRTQLAQQAKQMGEQTKVAIRNVRRDTNKHLEKQEKEHLITEDDLKNGKKQIDDITKKHTDEVDLVIKNKSDEILLG